MKKEEKNSFMGEWTPNEWGNFEESYLNDLKSSSDTSIDVAVKFSRKVFKTHSTSFFLSLQDFCQNFKVDTQQN